MAPQLRRKPTGPTKATTPPKAPVTTKKHVPEKSNETARKVTRKSAATKTKGPTALSVTTTETSCSNELREALESLKKANLEKEKFNLKDIRDLRKEFKIACDNTKRETQKVEQQSSAKKRCGTTRSGTVRGHVKQVIYSNGKYVNKGIDDSKVVFADDEKDYLRGRIGRVTQVNQLKYDDLKYLLIDLFLEDLKKIKQGEVKSYFHDRYKELSGSSKSDLMSEIRTSLFTNEQRDYISGLLQGAFDTITKDANGDIKHSDIDYVELVIFAEAITRVVLYVHKLKSIEEARDFMARSSRKACGILDDEDDCIVID